MISDVADGLVRVSEPMGPVTAVPPPEKVTGAFTVDTVRVRGVTAPIAIPSAGKFCATPPAHVLCVSESEHHSPSCTGVLAPATGVNMPRPYRFQELLLLYWADRKSTRPNSGHLVISYAVFCLKKKKTSQKPTTDNTPQHTITDESAAPRVR